ncbi:unnamed protein product, partial [Prorocentrum cordatum]
RSASKPPLQLTAAQQARIAADRAVARTRQEARAQERARSEHQSRAPWTAPGGSLRHEQEAEEEEPKHPDEGEAEEGDLVRFAPPPEPTKGGRDAPRARCRGGEGARAAAPSPPRRGLRGPLGAWATASTAAKQHSPALNVRPRRTKLPETRGRQSSATPEGLVCNRPGGGRGPRWSSPPRPEEARRGQCRAPPRPQWHRSQTTPRRFGGPEVVTTHTPCSRQKPWRTSARHPRPACAERPREGARLAARGPGVCCRRVPRAEAEAREATTRSRHSARGRPSLPRLRSAGASLLTLPREGRRPSLPRL